MKNIKTSRSLNIISGSILFLVVYMSLVFVGRVAAQSLLSGTALTTDPSQDLRPTWSPDGTQIAYFSGSSGNNDIWIMDADGENKQQITTHLADDRRPNWSPDGAWIVFDSDRSGVRDIWVVDISGGDPIQVNSSSATDNFPSWSSDGSQIAYYAYEGGKLDIWVIALNDLLEGGKAGLPVQVTTGLADETNNQCTFACHSPSWSPDSTQLAYSAENQSQIWVIGIDGSNPHQVVNSSTQLLQGLDHFPSWTPDGRLLFMFEHATSGGERVNDIWIMRPDGSNPTLIYPDIPHGGPLELRSDAVSVAFHSPRSGNFDIYTADLSQPQGEVIEDTSNGEVDSATAEEDESALTTDETPEEVVKSSNQPYTGLIWAVVTVVLGTGLIWIARKT